MKNLKNSQWFYILCLLIILAACSPSDSLFVYDLRCEYLKDPLGIDNPYCQDEPVDFKGFSPRISWKVSAKNGQVKQIAYRVMVSNTLDGIRQHKNILWDSGPVESSRQYCFVPDSIIQSSCNYYWMVGIYDEDILSCTWSDPARFSTGLLKKDWEGEWIGHPAAPTESHIWFRKEFILPDNAGTNIFAYVASAGYHELYVNGSKADDRVLAPAVSRLDKRILYVTYDIGALLRKGRNIIAVNYGPGWSMNSDFISETKQAVCLQVYGNKEFSLSSDTTWKCSEGYSKNTGHFDFMDMGGELVDGRKYTEQWAYPDLDDSKWAKTVRKNGYSPILSSQMTEPSRIIETISAKAISEIIDLTKLDISQNKIYRVDMGKEFTGFLEARFEGLNYGDTIEIMVSMRESNPGFVQATYGIANKVVEEQRQKQIYIARGEDGEIFKNKFNFFAGRYIHLRGLKKAPKLQNIKGLVISSAAENTATFSCSDSLYNKIFDLDRYTYQMCNTEGVTVDCPNRERLGYGPEGAYQTMWGLGLPCFSSSAYYVKNVRDWADVQSEDGFINNVAPQISNMYGCVLNGTAILNIAWEHYRFYGDRRILEMAYPVGKKWLGFLSGYVKDNILTRYAGYGYFLGEWVSPGPVFEYAETEEALFFNNCAYAMTLDFMIKIGRALGENQDVITNNGKLAVLREALHRKY
ncbi:MAG: family 78 glycoside hydrolase catalytic domain, partial [Prevotella sp.]|nr:family 78 glycoside hydrolase catalytic domain [Prevotella sp.]